MGTLINAIIKGQTELVLMPEQPKQDASGDYYYDFMPTGARLLSMDDVNHGLFPVDTAYLLMQSNGRILECHRRPLEELSVKGKYMIEAKRVYIFEQYIER
jgi:hypothetical protein